MRVDGFLFLFNPVDMFALSQPDFPPFFSEPTRFSVIFRTWLVCSDAIVYTGEFGRNLFKSGRGLIVFIFPIDLEPSGHPFGSKSVGGFRVDFSVYVFLSVCLLEIVCLILCF